MNDIISTNYSITQNKASLKWFDSHCHLANVAWLYDIDSIIKTASEKGIKGFLSCALSREEVRWHQLNRNHDIKFSAGIHPIYDTGTQLTMDDLDALLKDKQIFAVGEIGIDKRNRNLDRQIKLLKDQLSLANDYDLPVVLHVVGHHDVLYKILNDIPVRGIWHGFNASIDVIKQFSRFDLTFSMGHTLIENLKHENINAVIKYGNYLIESDAPYNVNKSEKLETTPQNPLTKIIYYANVISKLNGVKIESLNNDILKNVKQYFG